MKGKNMAMLAVAWLLAMAACLFLNKVDSILLLFFNI